MRGWYSGQGWWHAPWALQNYGCGAIVASSFTNTFKHNRAKMGQFDGERPEELRNVAVDADLKGNRYGILFLVRLADGVTERYVHTNKVDEGHQPQRSRS
jgi:3-isopropylmalate dehydratase small subunit